MVLIIYYFLPGAALFLCAYYDTKELSILSLYSHFSPHIIYNFYGSHSRVYFLLLGND